MANPTPTRADIDDLNTIWRRITSNAGSAYPKDFPFELISQGQATTESVTYYVETTGADTNDGTSLDRPLATPAGALAKLAGKNVRHLVNILVGIGSFPGFSFSGFTIDPAIAGPCGINILGTYVQYVPVTGTGSGTLSNAVTGSSASVPFTFTVVTDSTQNWVVDALKGKLFHVLSGTGLGGMNPIISNTATTITIASVGAIGTTSTYRIVDCGSVITTAVRTTPSLPTSTATSTPVGSLAGIHFNNNIAHGSSSLFQIEGLKIALTTASTFTGINVVDPKNLVIRRCQIIDNGLPSMTMISIIGRSNLLVTGCYIKSTATGISPSTDAGLSLTSCLLVSDTSSATRGIQAFGSGVISVSQCHIDCGTAVTGTGINLSPSGSTFLSVSFTRILGSYGVNMNGSAVGQMRGGSNFLFSSSEFIGVGTSGAGFLCSGAHVCEFTNSKLSNCSYDMQIWWGARVRIDPLTVLTFTNGGEVVLDNSIMTLAAMRAANPKLLANTYSTIVFE